MRLPAPAPPSALDPTPPVGVSIEGREIPCRLFGRFGPGAAAAPTVLVLGGIHGDEPAGSVLAAELCAYLEGHPGNPAGVRVVVAPAVNPDGLAAGTRVNARGVDVNRNFDTANRQAKAAHGPRGLSEPETRFLADLIDRYRPARIVTIHQPLACVDWDGPAEDLAAAVMAASGLPGRKLGSRPGSLGSYAGVELGIPTVTLELPAEASGTGPANLWRQYGPALLAAIEYGGSAK